MPTYITARDLKDTFPSLDEFDTKKPIYSWVTDSGSRYVSHDSGLVTALFVDGSNQGSAQANKAAVDANGEWFYDSAIDAVYYYNDSSTPEDLLMEAGEDFATLKTRVMKDASDYVDSKLDSNLPREQFLLKDGTYDYIIRRVTSLIAAFFLVKGKDPTSEIAEALFEEAQLHLNDLNAGKAKLGYQNSGDASRGVIRKVSVSGNLNIVDTRGNYFGSYDRLKVIVTTGGAIGTAKYSVFAKDDDNIKNNQVVTDEVINGDYQDLAAGLQIRFQGSSDSSTATQNDEWEVEVSGIYEELETPSMRSVKMTRKDFKQFYRGKNGSRIY
jgi:phage gp36-like protein|tara:strand:+ start:576 stop:1556 length:981 start_codon:yes stop_codon:yes gene_type:complete